ncbi:hypothetical protein BDR06DRAFT_953489 [Suillus hirtellus]|nr:hypothetical protein BDR06DRAFT_953489 [Suillus hirtellus]
MRFSLLAVIAALTASMSVSATPAVFSRDCKADYVACNLGSECCSCAHPLRLAIEVRWDVLSQGQKYQRVVRTRE